MAQVKSGDTLKFNFIGKMSDGTVFDTTYEEECTDDNCNDDSCADDGCGCGEAGPMELTIGQEQFFPQVEEALTGMAPGEKKTLTIASDDAFGPYDTEQVITVPRSDFPEDITPKVDDDLELTGDNGEGMIVTVIDVDEESVTLDANHPLAGEDLTFEIELLEIL
jgi:peptidylprolyl isomerase